MHESSGPHFTKEKPDPYETLYDFFSNFHLQDTREILREWLMAALSSECSTYNTGFARGNLIFVYEKLELLIEAMHLIHQRKKKRDKRRYRKRAQK